MYVGVHAAALRAYLALVAAHGYAAAGEIMRAVHRGDIDVALTVIDGCHLQRRRDRETLAAVEAAVDILAAAPAADGPDGALAIGHLAHRLRASPATLRKWERSGVLTPGRDPRTGQRRYGPADVRDAQLAHLLRRGGYPLAHIATVVGQVRGAGGAAPLAASLRDWRDRLTIRGRLALTAAGLLAAYLGSLTGASVPTPGPGPGPSDTTEAGRRAAGGDRSGRSRSAERSSSAECG